MYNKYRDEKENSWVDKAVELACKTAEAHGFRLSRAYGTPFGGWECLDMADKTAGFFKFYIFKQKDHLGFAIDSHYLIMDKDIFHNDMPCDLFGTGSEKFEDEIPDIEAVTKKIAAKVKGLNISIRRSVVALEKKYIIQHDADDSFDAYTVPSVEEEEKEETEND